MCSRGVKGLVAGANTVLVGLEDEEIEEIVVIGV